MSARVLNELLQPLVEDLGYEFVGLEYNPSPKNALLRIYIDTPDGIGIEDCEAVSREVAALLDVKDPIKSQYNLEVSSPGLDRPLFTPAHYRQFTGCEAQVTLFAPLHGRRKFKGPILAVGDMAVRIEQDGEAVDIAFDAIAKARLIPDYDAILAGRKD